MFNSLQPHDVPMYAANGALMPIGELGTAGPFSNVLFLPDLRVNIFSQKQAMHDGWKIILSSDARVFTVVVPPNGVLDFIFDGTFWIWGDDSQLLRPTQSEQAVAIISAAEPPGRSDNRRMAATNIHSGAVHAFLMLHFRLGHLKYTVMLRAMQVGTWTGFTHNLVHIHLSVPCVPPHEEQAPADN
jgi:hypothetical protein